MATNSTAPVLEKAQLSGQFSTFFVDDLFFGVDVLDVQEVLRFQQMTPVPQAPEIVEGLINLRGQIVTAIDLRRKLQLPERGGVSEPMNIVVRTSDGAVSLLVDEIGDVLDVEAGAYERPPENLDPTAQELIRGVYKLKDQLLLILDTEKASEAGSMPAGRGANLDGAYADGSSPRGWSASALNEALALDAAEAPNVRAAVKRGGRKSAASKGGGSASRQTH